MGPKKGQIYQFEIHFLCTRFILAEIECIKVSGCHTEGVLTLETWDASVPKYRLNFFQQCFLTKRWESEQTVPVQETQRKKHTIEIGWVGVIWFWHLTIERKLENSPNETNSREERKRKRKSDLNLDDGLISNRFYLSLSRPLFLQIFGWF